MRWAACSVHPVMLIVMWWPHWLSSTASIHVTQDYIAFISMYSFSYYGNIFNRVSYYHNGHVIVLQGHRPGHYQAASLHVTRDYVASMSTYLSTYYSNISSIVSYFHNGIDIPSDELCNCHVVMLQGYRLGCSRVVSLHAMLASPMLHEMCMYLCVGACRPGRPSANVWNK